jgi:peptide/nickel transport system permease protein
MLAFVWATLLRRKLWLMGYGIVALALLLAAVGPLVAPYPPETADPLVVLLPPQAQHLMGTDANGMDIFSRVIVAPRVDVTIALVGTLLSILIGVPLGLVTGYSRGIASPFLLRVADLLQAFPVFVLALVLVTATGQNVSNLIYIIAFLSAPIYMRLVRSQVLSLRERLFIESARAIGNTDGQIIFQHLLPNSTAPAFVQASVNVGFAILLTAGLSFIGAGVRVPTPEWGSMISIGAQNVISGEWWIAAFPGIALGVTVLGFALVADSLQFFLDPRNR